MIIALVGANHASSLLYNALARTGEFVVLVRSGTQSYTTASVTEWPAMDWNSIAAAIKTPPAEPPMEPGPPFPALRFHQLPPPVSPFVKKPQRYPIRQPCWRTGRWKSKT